MPKGVKYGQWQEDDICRALAPVRNGDVGINEAARIYCVPRAILQRRLAGKNCFAVEHKEIVGSTADLPAEVKEELVGYILKLEEPMFGITPRICVF